MTCSSCDAPIPAGDHFCPRCERPTSLASPEERARWEVLEWRRAKGEPAPPNAAESAPTAPAAPPVRTVRPPRRDISERLRRPHPSRDVSPEAPAAASEHPSGAPALEPDTPPEPDAGADTRSEARPVQATLDIASAEPAPPEPAPQPRVEPPVAAKPRVVVDEPAPPDRAAAFLREVLRERFVYVDAGARTGRYALLASSCVGSRGRAVAVEADPAKAQRLRQLAEHGASQLEVVHARLGPVDGARVIEVDVEADDDAIPDPTPLRTLDAVLRDLDVQRMDLLRVDVAGAAPDVLAGAVGWLTSSTFHGPVLIQIDSPALAARGMTPQDVLHAFPSETWADTTGLRLGSFTPSAPKHVRVFERRV